MVEATRPTEHPDALDYVLRGRAAQDKPSTREARAEAIGLFERALALDPRSVEAQSRLAGTLAGRALDGLADTAAADFSRAEGLAGQALAASPRSPCALRQRSGAACAGSSAVCTRTMRSRYCRRAEWPLWVDSGPSPDFLGRQGSTVSGHCQPDRGDSTMAQEPTGALR
jgi:hypothetical protein